MTFSRGELRPGMDVYARDGAYLGTVRAVLAGPPPLRAARLAVVEAGGHRFDGESLGPAPTQALGNRGPLTQSPANGYGTWPPPPESLGHGAIVVSRGWGGLRSQIVPVDDVLAVSLERVVLRAAGDLI